MNKLLLFCSLFLITFSCKNLVAPTVSNLDIPSSGTRIIQTGPYTLPKLKNQDVYVTRINKKRIVKNSDLGRVSIISSSGTQSVQSQFQTQSVEFEPPEEIAVTHERSQAFNTNPPEDLIQSLQQKKNARYILPPEAPYYKNGDTRNFYVEAGSGFTTITATLRDVGQRCYIWVPDTNYDKSGYSKLDNKINDLQIVALKDTFDKIYPLITNVFGDEYWSKLKNTYYDRNILSILVYDIDFDYYKSQNSGVVGYFWGKDYFAQSEQQYSNELEVFYIDAHMTDRFEKMVYSTLIHEFQHMINFNTKYVEAGISSVETWYNEMLSMIAEDMIYPLIEPADTAGWVINQRIPQFTTYYSYSGITEWLAGSSVFASYAQACAFGAFLTRNYGGANLVREIMANPYQGTISIGLAVQKLYPELYKNPNTAFTDLLVRYTEVLMNDDDQLGKTFNRTEESTINGKVYVFNKFSLWKSFGKPSFRNISDSESLRPYGYALLSDLKLTNVTGSVTLNFTLPFDPDIEYYIYTVPSKK